MAELRVAAFQQPLGFWTGQVCGAGGGPGGRAALWPCTQAASGGRGQSGPGQDIQARANPAAWHETGPAPGTLQPETEVAVRAGVHHTGSGQHGQRSRDVCLRPDTAAWC